MSFDAYYEARGTKHISGDIGKPTTLGNIERWFRIYDQEHVKFQLHRKYIQYYNYERPHMVLNYSTPAEVYFRYVKCPVTTQRGPFTHFPPTGVYIA